MDPDPPENGICINCRLKDLEDFLEKIDEQDQAIKYDQDKTRYDLFPPCALEEIGRVFTFGAKKYGDRNWQKGLAWGRIFAAIQRHLWAFWNGEDKDKETELLHLAHAGWGILALIWHYYNRPDLDDRFNKQNISQGK